MGSVGGSGFPMGCRGFEVACDHVSAASPFAEVSATGDGDDSHRGGAGTQHYARAFLDGGARREDIVNEDDVSFFHARSVAHAEGAAQVFHSLGAIEFCLRGGVARALEGVQNWDAAALRDERGDFGGLIKFALAKSDMMQRDGHECIERARGDTRVAEGLREPVRDRAPEMELTVVFEGMDEIADDSAAEMRGDGAFKMHFASGAIRAGELLRDGSLEWLRAAVAEWRLDALRTFRTGRAKVDARLGRDAARGAVRWEAERAERAEKSTCGRCDAHVQAMRGRARR